MKTSRQTRLNQAKSVLALSFILSISNLSSMKREKKKREYNDVAVSTKSHNNYKKQISYSEKELNKYVRAEYLKSYTGNDPENYNELLKMLKYNPFNEPQISINYDCQDYKNVDSDTLSNSSELYSRILYPCLRKDEEWSNWITNIQLNPKAQYILAKAALSLSSWDDLIYMLKKTRPLISELQLLELKKRKHLFKNPFQISDNIFIGDINLRYSAEKIRIKYSNYIFNLATYSFLSTMKTPFTEKNIQITKAIAIDTAAFAVKRVIGIKVDKYINRKQIAININKAVNKILKEKEDITKRR